MPFQFGGPHKFLVAILAFMVTHRVMDFLMSPQGRFVQEHFATNVTFGLFLPGMDHFVFLEDFQTPKGLVTGRAFKRPFSSMHPLMHHKAMIGS